MLQSTALFSLADGIGRRNDNIPYTRDFGTNRLTPSQRRGRPQSCLALSVSARSRQLAMPGRTVATGSQRPRDGKTVAGVAAGSGLNNKRPRVRIRVSVTLRQYIDIPCGLKQPPFSTTIDVGAHGGTTFGFRRNPATLRFAQGVHNGHVDGAEGWKQASHQAHRQRHRDSPQQDARAEAE